MFRLLVVALLKSYNNYTRYLVSTEQIVEVIQVGQGGVMEGVHTS